MNLQEQYAEAVCQFLAEQLRTRQVSLERAAEIAEGVVGRLERIKTDEEFQEAVREAHVEFEEMRQLQSRFESRAILSEREEMERLVREYAAGKLPLDPQAALLLLREALQPDTTLDWLLRKYPELNYYYKHEFKK